MSETVAKPENEAVEAEVKPETEVKSEEIPSVPLDSETDSKQMVSQTDNSQVKDVQSSEDLARKPEKIDATKWSKEMNDLFVDLLIRESSENYFEKNENDWCQGSWSRITNELELAFPLKAKVNKFDKTKLKKHLKILKDEHAYWRFIKDHAKGFHWIDERGCFSLDYYGVEEYFTINKFLEDPEVVDKYNKKKSWLRKFCLDRSGDYLAKYDKFIVNQDGSAVPDQTNGTTNGNVSDKIAEKRKLMFEDDEDDDEDDDGNKEKQDVSKWDDDDNDLLELTGYSCSPSKKRKLSLPPPVEFVSNVEKFKNVSDMIIKLVFDKKISAKTQQVVSRLLAVDPVLYTFLENSEYEEEKKIEYMNSLVAEYC